MPLAVEIGFLLVVFGLLIYVHQLRSGTTQKLDAASGLRDQMTNVQVANEALHKELVDCRSAIDSHASFLVNIGQEMRSPLSSVVGMNELLLHTELTKEQRELATAAMESAQSLLYMINDLQDLAQLDAHPNATTELCAVAVADIIREASASCAEAARLRHLFFNVDIDQAIPQVVLANRSVIVKILSKLLLNSIALTSKGGIVFRATKLSADQTQTAIAFVVKDSGVGLSDEEQRQLFLPFASEKVAGFGLYLCKRLAGTVGGALSVESKQGVGSEFRFIATFALPDARFAGARLEERRQAQDDQATSGNRPYTPPPSTDH